MDKDIPNMSRLFLGLAPELKYLVCAPPLQMRVNLNSRPRFLRNSTR